MLHDIAIGHIAAGLYAHLGNQRRERQRQCAVSYQTHWQAQARAGTKNQLLGILGAGVGVDPDSHRLYLLTSSAASLHGSCTGMIPDDAIQRAALRMHNHAQAKSTVLWTDIAGRMA